MKTSIEQLLEIDAHNKIVSKERIAIIEAKKDTVNRLDNEKCEEVWKLQEKYNQRIYKLQDEITRIESEFDKKVINRIDLVNKIKLRIITDHFLTDASCSYGHGQWNEEDVVREIDGNMFTVTVLVKENGNKVNKFSLRFFVGFKFYYLSDYFKDVLVGCYNLMEKAFKTREEAKAYSEKNSEKIMAPLYKRENELFKSIAKFEYDVLEEFDFRFIERNVSRETLVVLSKTEATFSIDYDRNPINVNYVGGGEFVVESGDEDFIKRFTSTIVWGTISRIPEKLIKITVKIPA